MTETLRYGALLLSGAFGIASFASYIHRMWKGVDIVPIVTCVATGSASVLAATSAWRANTELGVLIPNTVYAALSVAAFIASLRHGTRANSWPHWICLGISCCGLVGSVLAGNPLLGMALAIVADTVGYTPQLQKLLRSPKALGPRAYQLSVLSLIVGLLPYFGSIGMSAGFSFYLIILDTYVLILIYREEIWSVCMRLTRG